MKKVHIFLFLGTLLVVGLFINSFTGNVVKQDLEVIEIPISEISREANFYEHNKDGLLIKYFVVEDEKGNIKTAFNECDVCFQSQLGYRQEGDSMVCNNCGNRYPISGLGTENRAGGGCWPGYLPSRVEGENLVIEISDLNSGERLFR